MIEGTNPPRPVRTRAYVSDSDTEMHKKEKANKSIPTVEDISTHFSEIISLSRQK